MPTPTLSNYTHTHTILISQNSFLVFLRAGSYELGSLQLRSRDELVLMSLVAVTVVIGET